MWAKDKQDHQECVEICASVYVSFLLCQGGLDDDDNFSCTGQAGLTRMSFIQSSYFELVVKGKGVSEKWSLSDLSTVEDVG